MQLHCQYLDKEGRFIWQLEFALEKKAQQAHRNLNLASQGNTLRLLKQLAASSQTVFNPPSSRNLSLKYPPTRRTEPALSGIGQNEQEVNKCSLH